MGRKILALICSVAANYLFLFIVLTAVFLIIGVEASYLPGSYSTSMLWNAISLVMYALTGLIAGWLCVRITREYAPVIYWLIGLLVILGLGMAFSSTGVAVTAEVRPANVDPMTAMAKSVTPAWAPFVLPLMSAVGAFIGGRLGAPKGSVAQTPPLSPH